MAVSPGAMTGRPGVPEVLCCLGHTVDIVLGPAKLLVLTIWAGHGEDLLRQLASVREATPSQQICSPKLGTSNAEAKKQMGKGFNMFHDGSMFQMFQIRCAFSILSFSHSACPGFVKGIVKFATT